MASKRSTWGKSAEWNAPKKGRKTTTWGTPESVARAVAKRGKGKGKGKIARLFGPLY